VAKILIVEDDSVIADSMARHLSAAGFDPVVVARGELGLARLRFETPDVCVLDLMLPELDGWKLIETARAEGIGTPIVVVSARGTEHDRVHALEIGADDYLVKPFSGPSTSSFADCGRRSTAWRRVIRSSRPGSGSGTSWRRNERRRSGVVRA
jgi:DNA-binding response OmpR family regulator